jgi:hypothetical protein
MELQPQQMTSLTMGNPNESGFEAAYRLGSYRIGGQWGHGNFESQIRGTRKAAPGGEQNTAGADVQRGGKFQKLFPVLIDSANENRYR